MTTAISLLQRCLSPSGLPRPLSVPFARALGGHPVCPEEPRVSARQSLPNAWFSLHSANENMFRGVGAEGDGRGLRGLFVMSP